MIACYDKCLEGGYPVGKNLWDYLLKCGNVINYYDSKHQETIKQYNYCKDFNIPPYKSLQETPVVLLEDFSIIKTEVDSIVKQTKEENNGSKK
jgi:hypothetical protein